MKNFYEYDLIEWEEVDLDSTEDDEYEYVLVEKREMYQHTYDAIDMLLSHGIKTNIHYVLGNFSIDEAIHRLSHNGFPDGINAVIFLSHKPVGQGGHDDVLNVNDPKVENFFHVVDNGTRPFKVGFDSCTICGVLNFTKNVNMDSTDYCEGARHSCYVTPDMKLLPCSFDQNERWAVSLKNSSVKRAWYSPEFEHFRSYFHRSCPDCKDRKMCGGGCPIVPEIALCGRVEKLQLWGDQK